LERHYLKGVAAGAVMKGVALLLAFLLQLVAARVMGPEWYGEYTYALAWAGILSILLVAGADGAAVRFVAQLDAEGARSKTLVFIAWACQRMKRNLKPVIPAGLLLGGVLYASNSGFSLWTFLILLAAIFFQAGNQLSASILQGWKRPAFSQFPTGVLLPFFMIAALSGFFLFDLDARPEYVALSYLFAVSVVYFWITRVVKQGAQGIGAEPEKQDEGKWREVSHQLFLMAVIGVMLARFDILLLGWFVPVEEIGVYNVSARLAELTSLALVVSNLIVAPMIAGYYQRHESDRLQRLLTFSGRLVAATTLLALLAVVVFGEWVLGWYGEVFTGGYEVLLILSAGQLLNALFGPVGYLLIMTGHSGVALRIYAIAAVVMALLAILLTPLYGMIGAAVASAIGVVIWNILMCNYIIRHMGFDPTALGFFQAGK